MQPAKEAFKKSFTFLPGDVYMRFVFIWKILVFIGGSGAFLGTALLNVFEICKTT